MKTIFNRYLLSQSIIPLLAKIMQNMTFLYSILVIEYWCTHWKYNRSATGPTDVAFFHGLS